MQTIHKGGTSQKLENHLQNFENQYEFTKKVSFLPSKKRENSSGGAPKVMIKEKPIKPSMFNRFDFKNYKQTVLRLFKASHHDYLKIDVDFMRNEHFVNLITCLCKLKENPFEPISFEEEARSLSEKKLLIKTNQQTHKKLEAMEIFIKIYNSLKKIVNSWDSDQQV